MKTQMKFQKILSLVTLIFAALTCVYALSFMTEINALSFYMKGRNAGELKYPELGDPDTVYNLANDTAGVLFTIGIIFLLISITLYITASQKRRNYYITNYVSVIATAAAALVVAILGIVMVSRVVASYNANIDQEYFYDLTHLYTLASPEIFRPYLQGLGFSGADHITAAEYAVIEAQNATAAKAYTILEKNYGDPTLIFILGYVAYIAVFVLAALNVLNLLWKVELMKGERKLLEKSKVEEVA